MLQGRRSPEAPNSLAHNNLVQTVRSVSQYVTVEQSRFGSQDTRAGLARDTRRFVGWALVSWCQARR